MAQGDFAGVIKVVGLELGDHPGLSGWPGEITQPDVPCKRAHPCCCHCRKWARAEECWSQKLQIALSLLPEGSGDFLHIRGSGLASQRGREEMGSLSASGEEHSLRASTLTLVLISRAEFVGHGPSGLLCQLIRPLGDTGVTSK